MVEAVVAVKVPVIVRESAKVTPAAEALVTVRPYNCLPVPVPPAVIDCAPVPSKMI